MPKITNYEGKKIGIWKVIKKTEKRDYKGSILYTCLNTTSKKEVLKTSHFLTQVIKYKCKSDKRGRPRKWIIIKKPYIKKEA